MNLLHNSTGYPLYNADIIRGEGCFVYDRDGKSYLDFEAGVWALPFGHCDKDITAAMHQQIEELVHVGYKYNQQIAQTCAEKLIEITSMKDGNCVFLTSGSEAVEYGIQLAMHIKPDKRCACLKGQYLAAYGHVLDQQDTNWITLDWDLKDTKSVEAHYHELTNTIDFATVGTFVFEPGNSSGIVKLPPSNFVAAINQICQEYQIVVIVDEVTTGIGRTGRWFGYMNYDLTPSIIAAGKGLGNGYPVSAVILSSDIVAAAQDKDFHYAQSHQNDPLGCRIAYEVLQKLERDDLLTKVPCLGAYFRQQYQKLQQEFPVIIEVRGIGLLNCIELSDTISSQTMGKIDGLLFERGVIAGVKPKEKVIRTYCPLIVTTDLIDHYIDVLRSVFIEVELKNNDICPSDKDVEF